MPTSTIVGDSQAVARHGKVSALPISSVTAAELADVDSFINSALESGKKLGACILVDNGDVAIAQGSGATDSWKLVSDAGAAPVTPS